MFVARFTRSRSATTWSTLLTWSVLLFDVSGSVVTAAATLASTAAAAHLNGPMDDRMDACIAKNCATFSDFMDAADFQGTGMSFGTFVSPPMNSNPFIYDQTFTTNVLGLKGATGNFMYRKVGGQPQNITGKATKDHSAHFECVCEKCGGPIEAIFQPIGRAICETVGKSLPCQTEFDACKAANAGSITSTGSLAAGNLKYPPVGGGGNWTASADVCHPEAAFYGYKVGYNLTEDCNAGKTALKKGGGATAFALAKCVAKSRVGAYQADFNCQIGRASCRERV